jgi:hypothetical protein
VAARRHRWLRWVLGIVGGLVVLVAIAVVLFFVFTRNPEVGAFYDPPDDVPADPGAILRAEPFDDGLPTGARGWKVLYASTDAEGRPLAVSGLIIASATPTPGPHPVLAWAHGTTGIARPCAPSVTDDPLDGIPDMTAPIDRGWVIALTDYPGLGTPSPHPYLVGESEGRAVLDSVRAAHRLDIGMELDDTYAVWGHSQGGQNLSAIQGTEAGNLLSILAVESWQDYYPDIPPDSLVPDARGPAGRIAKLCLNQPSRFRILLNIPALPKNIMGIDPDTNPIWKGHLDTNTPSPTGISGPVFVAQGLADEVVAPAVTTTWVTDRCTAGSPTVFHTYPDITHDGVVGPGGADAYSWTIDRLEGTEPPDDCP